MSRQAIDHWSVRQPRVIHQPSMRSASASNMATTFRSRLIGLAREAMSSTSQREVSRSLTRRLRLDSRRRSRRGCFTGRSSGNNFSRSLWLLCSFEVGESETAEVIPCSCSQFTTSRFAAARSLPQAAPSRRAVPRRALESTRLSRRAPAPPRRRATGTRPAIRPAGRSAP